MVMPDLAAALPFLRDQAESLMLDDCRITRVSGTSTLDPNTGLPVADPPATIYGGTGDHEHDRCKIQSEAVVTLTPKSGDHTYTVDRWMIHIPVSATGVKVGDKITITGSALDPANVGRIFTVTGLFRKTMATAQRIPVEEVL